MDRHGYDLEVYLHFSLMISTAYLTEEDVNLQKVAAISDHLLITLSGYFNATDPDDAFNSMMREVSQLGCDDYIGNARISFRSNV